MVMKNEGSIEIDRSIEDVFDYTTNNVAEWSLTVKSEEPLQTVNDGGAGSTFRCVTQSEQQEMEFQGEVLRHEPPQLSQSKLTGTMFDIDVLYVFEAITANRTRVTQASVVTPKTPVLKIVFGLFGWLMKKGSCKATQKELQSLKAKLETPT